MNKGLVATNDSKEQSVDMSIAGTISGEFDKF